MIGHALAITVVIINLIVNIDISIKDEQDTLAEGALQNPHTEVRQVRVVDTTRAAASGGGGGGCNSSIDAAQPASVASALQDGCAAMEQAAELIITSAGLLRDAMRQLAAGKGKGGDKGKGKEKGKKGKWPY